MQVLANLDLVRNQLLNAVLQNLAGTTPATPVEGQIFYDTTANNAQVYNGSGWEVLSISTHTHAYIPLATVTEQGDIIYASGSGAVAALPHHATSGYLLATGGHGANPSWVAPYTHPTTDGNVHVPATGASANILQYASAGTAKWIAMSGDVTIADAGATTIAAGAVDLAMMANIATLKIIGRSTAETGVPEAITCTAAGFAILDDATAADQRTTLGLGTMATATATDYIAKAVGTAHGDILYFSASATPAVLAHGTDNQLLTAHTDGSLTWENPGASHTQNTDTGTTSATFILDSDHATEDQRITLKNNAGVLELKSHDDGAYMDFMCKDLTVQGTTFTVHAETVTLHDNILLLDDNAATAGATAGIQVERGSTGADASLIWLEASSFWEAGIVGSEMQVARKYAVDVGDGAAESIDVVHNLNSRDVVVSVVTKASTYDAVMCDWVAKDANTVTLTFAVHPAEAAYRCVVVG